MERFIRPHRKHPDHVQRILNVELLPYLGARDVRTIKPRDIIDLLDRIVERGSPIMANRVAGILAQLFKFAVHRAVLETSPVQLLYRPGGPERPRERVLSDEELGALLNGNEEIFKRAPRTASVIRLALLTACRRAELTRARWKDIDLESDAPTWRIPPENSKTGSECINALVPEAVEEFRRLKVLARRSPWVFPADAGDGPSDPKLLTRSIARHLPSLKERRIGAFTLHDLRRTTRTGVISPQVEGRQK
jgi:integrase